MDQFQRINTRPLHAHAPMQVRSCCAASGADKSDNVSFFDFLSWFDEDLGEVEEHCIDALAVVQHEGSAGEELFVNEGHDSVVRGDYFVAFLPFDVNAGVWALRNVVNDPPHAEGCYNFTFERIDKIASP
jgi:hypothetical protein